MNIKPQYRDKLYIYILYCNIRDRDILTHGCVFWMYSEFVPPTCCSSCLPKVEWARHVARHCRRNRLWWELIVHGITHKYARTKEKKRNCGLVWTFKVSFCITAVCMCTSCGCRNDWNTKCRGNLKRKDLTCAQPSCSQVSSHSVCLIFGFLKATILNCCLSTLFVLI